MEPFPLRPKLDYKNSNFLYQSNLIKFSAYHVIKIFIFTALKFWPINTSTLHLSITFSVLLVVANVHYFKTSAHKLTQQSLQPPSTYKSFSYIHHKPLSIINHNITSVKLTQEPFTLRSWASLVVRHDSHPVEGVWHQTHNKAMWFCSSLQLDDVVCLIVLASPVLDLQIQKSISLSIYVHISFTGDIEICTLEIYWTLP